MQNETDLYTPKSYSVLDFVIGLLVTIGASVVNALGLNITKLDFSRQEDLPSASRRPDWKRPFWWLGLILYISSQVVGSTLALEFLRAEYVAPLGSTSLVFNFVFAYLLVGTPVTRLDIAGTIVIVLGVVGVVAFGNNRLPTEFDKESNLSLSLLKQLWGRGDWIAYIVVLEATTAVAFWLSTIMHEVCMNRVEDERGPAEPEERLGTGGRRGPELTGWKGALAQVGRAHSAVRGSLRTWLVQWSNSRPDSTIRKAAGLCWSITGGLLAGQSLVFAKSAVKLVTSAINKSDPNEPNQFTSPLSWLIVILLVVSAVTQIYCLNASLRCYDSTFCVPIFFATYTTCGFINSLVYLDELKTYKTWVFLCIWASIAVLILGVVLLSWKKPVTRQRSPSMLDGDEGRDGIGMTTPVGTPGLEMHKGQGWLGNLKVFQSSDRTATLSTTKTAPGQLTQKDRRQQPGLQKLDDVDSVLENERPESSAHDLEMDEVDALEFHSKKDGDAEEGDDDFGDFKHAEEGRTL